MVSYDSTNGANAHVPICPQSFREQWGENTLQPAPKLPGPMIKSRNAADIFKSIPPPRRYLVDGRIEMGKATIVAFRNDYKVRLAMDNLAMAVASSRDITAPGISVSVTGAAAILTASDDDEEYGKYRAFKLDPDGSIRRECDNRLFRKSFVAFRPLFVAPRGRVAEPTMLADEMVARLRDIQGLKLIVLDRLEGFAPVDLGNPVNAPVVAFWLSSLASQTGAAVLATRWTMPGRRRCPSSIFPLGKPHRGTWRLSDRRTTFSYSIYPGKTEQAYSALERALGLGSVIFEEGARAK